MDERLAHLLGLQLLAYNPHYHKAVTEGDVLQNPSNLKSQLRDDPPRVSPSSSQKSSHFRGTSHLSKGSWALEGFAFEFIV